MVKRKILRKDHETLKSLVKRSSRPIASYRSESFTRRWYRIGWMNYSIVKKPNCVEIVQLWRRDSWRSGEGRERGKSEWQLTREVNPDCPVGPCHSPFNSGGPSPEEKFEEFDESSVEHTDRTFRWRDYDLSHEFLPLIPFRATDNRFLYFFLSEKEKKYLLSLGIFFLF